MDQTGCHSQALKRIGKSTSTRGSRLLSPNTFRSFVATMSATTVRQDSHGGPGAGVLSQRTWGAYSATTMLRWLSPPSEELALNQGPKASCRDFPRRETQEKTYLYQQQSPHAPSQPHTSGTLYKPPEPSASNSRARSPHRAAAAAARSIVRRYS